MLDSPDKQNQAALASIISNIMDLLTNEIHKLAVPYTHPAFNIKMGEFRTPFNTNEGVEWSNIRQFKLDDNIKHLSKQSLPYFTNDNETFKRAYTMGLIKVNQWQQYVEKELVLVLDASRSMLSGIFMCPTSLPDKLINYFHTLTSLLSIANAKRFKLKVIIAFNGTHKELICDHKESYLGQITEHLKQIWFQSLNNYKDNMAESDALQSALSHVLLLKNKALVIVLSDFLEPITSYDFRLQQLMKKHHTILADIASKEDRDYPVPRFFHYRYSSIPRWDGARDLEKSALTPVCNTKESIKKWNSEQQQNFTALINLANANQINIYNFNLNDEDKIFHQLCKSLMEVN